jgi:hypothetical protein
MHPNGDWDSIQEILLERCTDDLYAGSQAGELYAIELLKATRDSGAWPVRGELGFPWHGSPPVILGREQLRRLLQLRVLRFGFLQDGDVGVGVFPEREEILISGARPGRITHKRQSPPEPEFRQCPIRPWAESSTVI